MAPPAVAAEATYLLHPSVRRVTVSVLTLVGLSAFEGLAVAAALPEVAAALGDVALLPWVITAYLLLSGVSTVAAGALADRIGLRAVFRGAVALFVLGGVLAGFAPDMKTLIAARVIHGTGAGAVNAVGLTAVGAVFPQRLVARAFAANSIVWGVMSVAGPALAALLLSVASWRWIFWMNLPLGGAALLLGWNAMPGARPAVSRALRWSDLLLLMGASMALLVGVDAMDLSSIPALLVAGALGAFLLYRSRGRDDALLAPRHVLSAPLGPLAGAMGLLLVGAIGTQSFLPLYVSGAREGGTELVAGSVLFFVLGWTSGANVASRLAPRTGPARVLRVGTAIVPFALAAVSAVAWQQGPLYLLFGALVVVGLGMGLATNTALSLVRTLAPEGELGRATAAHQFVRNLGFLLGNALFGALMLWVVATLTGDVESVRAVLGQGSEAAPQPSVVAAIHTGFATAATVSACVALLASLLVPWATRTLRSP